MNRNGEIGLHIVRIFDDEGLAWSSDVVNELQACADSGANVVNMSFGRIGGYLQYEAEAYQTFYDNGMLFVAAAGNHGAEGFGTDYGYPASYDSVISVAAVDEFKNVGFFSAFNDQVELSGPGVQVLSTVPNDGYEYFDGTSM